jgi:hypothetical protein
MVERLYRAGWCNLACTSRSVFVERAGAVENVQRR